MTTTTKKIDEEAGPTADITQIEYGFLLDGRLLNIQIVWTDSNGTYQLYAKPPLDQVKVDREATNMGEWTTTCPITILHMYLNPKEFRGRNRKHPQYQLGHAKPVAIHTYRFGNSMRKLYIPMTIPQALPNGDMESTAVSMTEIEAGLNDMRQLYMAVGPLVVGTIYYSLVYTTEPLFYECLAQIGNQYLMLLLNEADVVMKLTG